MALTPADIKDLEYSINRMNGLTAVFRMRSEQAAHDRFELFGELMDLYLACCVKSVSAGIDYKRNGIVMDEEQRQEAQQILSNIFKEASNDPGE